MHQRKYNQDYTRRHCLESFGKGLVSAGVLMPLFDAWANSGDIRAAYPDEALDIETYSKGAVKPGGILDAGNVDSVKDLLDPASYLQIKDQGRICRVKATTTDINQLNPIPYLRATAKNAGLARFDAKGNVVTPDGKPWIGGIAFPKPENGQQIIASHALNWGRHDQASSPTRMEVVDPAGETQYLYETYWVEVYTTGRSVMQPQPYVPGQEDTLRHVTFLSTYPADRAGAAVLNIWSYDQTSFPLLYFYDPSFKRVRRGSGNKRFEPFLNGSSMTASDTWMFGDPYMTWGNFKILGKTPFIGPVAGNWNASDPNWAMERAGGRSGKKFFVTTVELIPEAFVVEAEPVGYRSPPLSKRRIWFDARTLQPVNMIDYGQDGQPSKACAMSFDVFSKDGQTISDLHPRPGEFPFWSYCGGWLHDLKTDQVTLLSLPKQISGGYSLRVNDPDAFAQFSTVSGLQNLGA